MFGYEFDVQGEPNKANETKESEPKLQSSWFSGFSGILANVQDAAQQAVQIIKDDLIEIADAGQELAETTKNAVNMENIEAGLQEIDQALGNIENVAKSGISKLGVEITQGINSLFIAEADEPALKNMKSRTEALIHDAGLDRATYLEEIKDPILKTRFEQFKLRFDRVSHAGRIGSLLASQPKILKLKDELGMFINKYPALLPKRDFGSAISSQYPNYCWPKNKDKKSI